MKIVRPCDEAVTRILGEGRFPKRRDVIFGKWDVERVASISGGSDESDEYIIDVEWMWMIFWDDGNAILEGDAAMWECLRGSVVDIEEMEDIENDELFG